MTLFCVSLKSDGSVKQDACIRKAYNDDVNKIIHFSQQTHEMVCNIVANRHREAHKIAKQLHDAMLAGDSAKVASQN